jgi:uncharacterized protein YegP (UPF0339 family)
VKLCATWFDDEPDRSSGKEEDMAGKFVLKKGTSGKFHFNLLAGNGQVIATSETYESHQSALKGIESVKANAPGAEVDDQTSD